MEVQKLRHILVLLFILKLTGIYCQEENSKVNTDSIDILKNIATGNIDTILYQNIGSKKIKTILNENYFESYQNDVFSKYYSRLNPRIIKLNNTLFYFRVRRTAEGQIMHELNLNQMSYKIPSTYHYSGWQNKGHLIFDIYSGELVYHDSNFLALNKKEPTRIYPTSIKALDFVVSANLENRNKERNFPKPGSYLSRSGYLVEAFNNRKTLDEYKITLTSDSLTPIEALKESWYDFHIDNNGITHAFVYLRGELIYLNQMKPSNDQLAPTSWKEIFSGPATDNIGPFTSVTVQGKQYLFTQDGTILKNTGKAMKKVGKLPGDLIQTSIVWDKEADKIWYITWGEFEAIKEGDTTVLQHMHKISLDLR